MKRIFLLLSFGLAGHLAAAQGNPAEIKLFRFGGFENEKPAVEYPDGTRLDVSSFGEDFDEKFFATDGIQRLQSWLTGNAGKCPKVAPGERFGSCVARPSKIVAIGLNYVEHVKEGAGAGRAVNLPREPIIFMKASTALCGPFDEAIIPEGSEKLDWEVELAVIIGKKASNVPESEAMSYVAGYSVVNDYSERAWQLEKDGGQWDKGKSADHFAPLGPYLVLAANLPDPNSVDLWLTVNGNNMQQANTRDMIFNVAHLVSYTSRHMTLLPGDVIATGTPSGVGNARNPKVFLKPGDVVELGIEKVGQQKQTVVSFIQTRLTGDEYKDFQAWVSLGVGGLPHTLEGYRTLKALQLQMNNPLDVGRIAPALKEKDNQGYLKSLPKRKGTRPAIAPFPIPHRQTNQHNDGQFRSAVQASFDKMVASNGAVAYKMSGFERHNKAVFLKDSLSGNPALVNAARGEIAHIHPSDGSIHFCYPSPGDAKKVIEAGWGEFHGLAGTSRLTPTYLMVYSPRDDKELQVVMKILEAAISFATNTSR